MGRSNKEQRDTGMGSGLLDNARRALQGRKSRLDDAIDQMETGQYEKKRKRKASDEESE